MQVNNDNPPTYEAAIQDNSNTPILPSPSYELFETRAGRLKHMCVQNARACDPRRFCQTHEEKSKLFFATTVTCGVWGGLMALGGITVMSLIAGDVLTEDEGYPPVGVAGVSTIIGITSALTSCICGIYQHERAR